MPHANYRLIGFLAVLCACSQRQSPEAPSCAQNSDCKEGLVCALRSCRTPCKQSRDCGEGASCITDGVSAVCQPLQERDTACELERDCSAPLSCASDYRCRNRCVFDGDCNVLGISGRACALDMRGARYCAEPPEVVNGLLVATPPPGSKLPPYPPWDAAALTPVREPDASTSDEIRADANVDGSRPADASVDASLKTDASAASEKLAPVELMARVPNAWNGESQAMAALALDSRGRPLIISRDSPARGGQALATKLEAGDSVLTPVGPPISTRTLWSTPSIVFDGSDVPYVALQQLNFDGGGTELLVRRFDGTAWQDVVPPTALKVTNMNDKRRWRPRLRFDPQGQLFLAVCTEIERDTPLVYRVQAGALEALGPVEAPTPPNECDLAISPTGELLLAFKFPTVYEVWRRAAGRWGPMSTLGAAASVFPSGFRLLFVGNDLHAAWNDNNVVHVARFDGSKWNELPFAPVNPINSRGVELALVNGLLTLAVPVNHLDKMKADIYHHREGAWERDTPPLATTGLSGEIDAYSLASRAGYTYLSYTTETTVGLYRLTAP